MESEKIRNVNSGNDFSAYHRTDVTPENKGREEIINTRIIKSRREMYNTNEEQNPRMNSTQICKFHQQRRCKFGNFCYNLHVEKTKQDVVETRINRSSNTTPRL